MEIFNVGIGAGNPTFDAFIAFVPFI